MSAWGDRWGGRWGGRWGAVGTVTPPVIPPSAVNYQGGGGSGLGRKKRRNERQELFDAIERSIRAQLEAPGVEEVEPVAASVTVEKEDWSKLKQYAADNEELSARLTALKRDLDRYEAEQQALRDDDEDFWMMV